MHSYVRMVWFFSAFVHTNTFSMDHTHCFINETEMNWETGVDHPTAIIARGMWARWKYQKCQLCRGPDLGHSNFTIWNTYNKYKVICNYVSHWETLYAFTHEIQHYNVIDYLNLQQVDRIVQDIILIDVHSPGSYSERVWSKTAVLLIKHELVLSSSAAKPKNCRYRLDKTEELSGETCLASADKWKTSSHVGLISILIADLKRKMCYGER